VCAIRSQLLLAAFHDPVDPQEVIALSLKSLELLPEVEKTVRSTCAITLAHAYLMMADVAEAEKALAVSLGMALEAGNFFSAVTAYFYQARIAYHLGRLERCIEICQEGLEKLTPNFQHPDMEFPAIRSLYVPQAVVRLERNELAEAERLLSRATNLVGWAPWVELIAYTSLARLWELRGDPARVLETLKRMEKNGPQLAYCAEALRTLYQARTHADDEHTLALAAIWAGTHAPDRGERQVVLGIGPFQVDAEYTAYLAWLHIQILTGQPQAALEFIAPVLADAHKKGLRQRVIELSVAQALACIAAGEPQPAREALKPALALAEPEGFRNSFNQGRELARLLGDLAVRGIARETIQRIIAVWQPQGEPGKGDGSAAGRPAKMPELVDPLSDRELEVLRLLEKGLTIPEIAKVLYLSPNTLKAHSQNIYSKLDVHNRLQAVRRAKELGYLKDEG